MRWRPAQHNQITLPQLDSEVFNPTGLAENKGLIVSNRKRLFTVKKIDKQEAVDCIAIIKRRTGVHSSLEVSLHKTIKCWVLTKSYSKQSKTKLKTKTKTLQEQHIAYEAIKI